MRLEQTDIKAKEISSFLNGCKFNPVEAGPQNVAARSRDSQYCINRAIEELVSGKPISNAVKFLAIAGVMETRAGSILGK